MGNLTSEYFRFFFGLKRKNSIRLEHKSITVLIPAYNEEKSICHTIDSIKSQLYYIDNIIVINDCSTDNTYSIVKEAYPDINIITTDKNTGSKSRALNYGLKYVTTELVCFVDADTVLDKYAVKNCIHHFEDLKTGAVSGFVKPKNSSNFWERGRLIEYLNGCGINKSAQDNANIVMIASGCFTIMRTLKIKQLGGFKERSMAEDMDLTWELIENNLDIRHENSAICTVVDPPNWTIYRKQMERWQHGFLQCIKVRGFKGLFKSPKLGMIVLLYLALGIILPFVFLTFVIINPIKILPSLLLLHFIIVGLPSFYYGIKLKYKFSTILHSWFDSIFLQQINMVIFMKCVFYEFILNKTVKTWVKGH